jgi:hypothetical protein
MIVSSYHSIKQQNEGTNTCKEHLVDCMCPWRLIMQSSVETCWSFVFVLAISKLNKWVLIRLGWYICLSGMKTKRKNIYGETLKICCFLSKEKEIG